MELYWRGDQVGGGQSDYVGKALAHFYRAIDIDSSASALLMAAQAEWAVTYDLPKVDTLLEIVERFGSNLRPLDRAQFDRLRAWLDGDLEGAMNASSRRAEMGFAGADVQDAIRLNRLDEALDQSNAILAKPMLRKSEDLWEWRTQIHHVRGDYKRNPGTGRTWSVEYAPGATRRAEIN
jgi:hypothetical protein